MSNNAKECLVKTSSITRTTSFRFPDAPSPGAGPLLRALQKRSWDTVSESLADTASHGEHGLNRLHPNKKKKSNDHDRARGFSSSGHSSASTVVDSQSAASPPSDGKDSHGVHEHTGEGVRLSRALQRAQAVLCVLLTPSASDFDSFLN